MLSTRLRDRMLAHYLVAGRDWSKTRIVFTVPDGRLHVRLNLEGREAGGIVARGEMDAELGRIERELLSARTESGEPIFSEMSRLSELFAGPRLDLLPDLVARIHQRPIGEVITMADGQRLRTPWRHGRDADHRPEGFYIQVGAGIAQAAEGPMVAGQDLARVACGLVGIDL
jgi:predicted AlkP superfamily phosphohydrolase/phosphomutase